MKKLITALFLTCFLASSAQAGGVSSSSLTSLRDYSNLSVRGFQEADYSVELISDAAKVYNLAGALQGEIQTTGAEFIGSIDDFYYMVSAGSNRVTGLGDGSASGLGAGWANEDISFSVALGMMDLGGAKADLTSVGFSWRISDLFYFGVNMDDQKSIAFGDNVNTMIGLSIKEDGIYRVELVSSSSVEAGVSTPMQWIEAEYQLGNLVFGLQADTTKALGVTYNGSVAYLAWQPEKDGVTLYLGQKNDATATTNSKSSTVKIGYDF